MATLVERVRATISVEDDDFFEDSTIVDYLNSSLNRIVSYLTSVETRTARSLRALDLLRKSQPATATAAPTLVSSGIYQGTVNVPTDLLQLMNMTYKTSTRMRELHPGKTDMIFAGNAQPSVNESYYTFLVSGSTRTARVFVHESDAVGTYTLTYVAKPTALTDASTAVASLPKSLENAVIYGAAEMLLLQESPKDMNVNIDRIRTIYQEELAGGTF
jgi:hypothetical protein